MDMDGRSLGTERPSTFLGGVHAGAGDGQGSSADPAGAARFAALLATRTRFGTGEVEKEIAGRIGEGRTDAASAAYHSRTIQEKVWKPRRSLSDTAGAEAGSDTEVVRELGGNEAGQPAEAAASDAATPADLASHSDVEASPDTPAQANAVVPRPVDEGPIEFDPTHGGRAGESSQEPASDAATEDGSQGNAQEGSSSAAQGAAIVSGATAQAPRAGEAPAQSTGRV
ncbi:MAG: hypothetical protein AAGG01_06270, partial [Planctomycetota bacterium]